MLSKTPRLPERFIPQVTFIVSFIVKLATCWNNGVFGKVFLNQVFSSFVFNAKEENCIEPDDFWRFQDSDGKTVNEIYQNVYQKQKFVIEKRS